MPTFTVHEPPPRQTESVADPERFAFVRDGFYFWAFVLPPLWLLVHRLWLALVLFVVGSVLIGAGLFMAGAPAIVQASTDVLIGLFIGFEASSVKRWTLARRGWRQLGFVIGETQEEAEQRFFAEWTKRPASPAEPSSRTPAYAAPVRRGPPSPSDVIGLFPEPGGSR